MPSKYSSKRQPEDYDSRVNELFDLVVDGLEEDMEDTLDMRVGWDASGPGGRDGKFYVRDVARYFFAQGLAMGTDVRVKSETKRLKRR